IKHLFPSTRLPSLLITAVLAFASPVFAVDPPPDGGYPDQNTAEGEDALFNLTVGTDNTAVGYHALHSNMTGNDNTAIGYNALSSNTLGSTNTAYGSRALLSNATGSGNTGM